MYNLKKDKNIYALQLDQVDQVCPFQTKLLVPGKLQRTLDLQEFTCSSQCSLFEYNKIANTVIQHCAKRTIEVGMISDTNNTIPLFKPTL